MLLKKINKEVKKIEPQAEVYLFGSRARGNYTQDSDWDILILLPGEVNWKRKRPIIHSLFEIELSERQIFNLIIHSKDYWNKNNLMQVSPFVRNVNQDKIKL